MSDDELEELGVSEVEESEPIEPDELVVPGELMVPGEDESEREPAPEPAPEPMLPELEFPGEVDDDDERLLLSLGCALDHFWYSDCDSAPSLLPSAVVNAPLRSELIAASVWEMRPSRLASRPENVELLAPAPLAEELLELMDPLGLDALLPWLELLGDELLFGIDELLWPNAVAAITAAATALIVAGFFMIVLAGFED